MTRGEAINARASAGSRLVEARKRFERFREMADRNSRVAVELVHAEIDYAAALGVEASFSHPTSSPDGKRPNATIGS